MLPKHEINLYDVNDVYRLLHGDYIEYSQYYGHPPMDSMPPDLPVDIQKVLIGCVYHNPGCKNVFQQALLKLGNGDAANVYLCYKFFNNCMYFEIDRKCATFQIDRELFIPLLKRQIKRYASELRGTLFFRGNVVPLENGMNNIIDFNNYAKKHYGFSILDE
jgi:hypothetical protein